MAEKREITIYDLAAKLGTSASTVSRALKDHPAISRAMVKKVRDLADRMGYQPNVFAASIRQNRTNTIGILIPRITSDFMSKAVTAIEEVLNRSGYNIIISQSDESAKKEEANARTLFNSRVDGLIVSLSNETAGYDHFKPFIEKDIPVVFFDRVCREIKGVKVTIDDVAAGMSAADHLIKKGKKRIAVLTGSLKRNVYKDRLTGYKKALKKHTIPADDSLIIESALTLESGRDVVKKLMKLKKKPDAIFACNDISAIGCILQLKEMGIKVPADVAVIGFNNDAAAGIISPALTTIDHPVKEMGRTAAEMMLKALQGEKAHPSDVVLKTKLVVRESA